MLSNKIVFVTNLIDTIKFPFRKDKELYRSFYDMMGFYPHHIQHYKQALMHKSVSMKNEKGRPLNNERLEFLGDAILGAVVGDIVYQRFQGKREGFLTNARSKIVQRETLGKVATKVGLSKLIQTNGSFHSHNSYIEGNALEALIGAIYLDRGYDYCMLFVKKQILGHVLNLDKMVQQEANFKSKLLEWNQKNRVQLEYRLVKETHEENGTPIFLSQVILEGIECGKGKGYSKKESHQIASKETLMALRKDPKLEQHILKMKEQHAVMEIPAEAVAVTY
ncbi:MAG: ribonuclease III [Bacteroidaceae bacterium]|nr:ribonuclease III [Bacteroidaceae bacterium]